MAAEAAELILRKGWELPDLKYEKLPKGKLASYDSTYGTITVTTSKPAGGWNAHMEELERIGWHSHHNSVLHELGHYIHHTMAGLDYDRGSEYGWDKGLGKDKITSLLSKYASTGKKDFTAELIAGILSGKVYPKEIMDISFLRNMHGSGADERLNDLWAMGSGDIPNTTALQQQWGDMIHAVYTEGGASFKIELLANPEVEKFIDTHAQVLDNTFALTDMSDVMRERLQKSDYIFSGIKTFHELHEVFPSLLDEDGKRKPFEQFLSDVQKVDNTYNRNYLNAEYNFAQASSEMAGKWEDFVEDGDDYLLQYRTQQDSKVRPEHAELHGITLPVTDSFWDEYFPPNGWNCRCTVVQVLKGKNVPTDHDEAMSRGKVAVAKDTKGMFRFNPGKEMRTFPAYNAYTISKCATCDKAKCNLSEAPNELCKACLVLHTETNMEEVQKSRELYDKIRDNKQYKDVEFDEKTGGLKATHVYHNEKSNGAFYFGEEKLTGLALEKECQDEVFKFGKTCILLPEGEKGKDGNELPAIDSFMFGRLVEIRSITSDSESYRNAICKKNKQIHDYNNTHETNADSLCLYFHDPEMYDPGKVFKGYQKTYTQGEKTYENIIKHIYCVVKGRGIYQYDF